MVRHQVDTTPTPECPKGKVYVQGLFEFGCHEGYYEDANLLFWEPDYCVCSRSPTPITPIDGVTPGVKEIMLIRGPTAKDTSFVVQARGFTPNTNVSLQTVAWIRPVTFQTGRTNAEGVVQLEGDLTGVIDAEKETQVISVYVCEDKPAGACTESLPIRYTRTTSILEEFTGIFGEAWKETRGWILLTVVVIFLIFALFAFRPKVPGLPHKPRTGAAYSP